jgi:hypothetical protein
MSPVAWYLRRAVPWAALLGCSAGAVVVAALLERWPSSSLVLLPTLLACCAAAAAFSFDESALPVIAVTPRGAAWRRLARLGAAAVPVLVFAGVVAARPGDLPLARGSWLLLGGGAIGLSTGLAALASRRHVPRPGGALSGLVVLAVLGPVVVTAFLGWDSIYPVGEFGTGVRNLWLGVAGVAVLTCLAALRPGVRR